MQIPDNAPGADVPELLTRSQMADFLDCAKSYITKLGNQGRLVLAEDGRIRVRETLRLLQQTTGAPERAMPEAQTPAYTDWRERGERARAEMLEIELAERRGTLLPLDTVRAALTSAVTTLRSRLEMLPDQVAAQLMGARDEGHARALLAGEIETALAELSHQVAAIGRKAT